MASFIEVPGARLHVVEEGAGPPIVLVHAGIACLESSGRPRPAPGRGWLSGGPLRRPRLGPLDDGRRGVLGAG